MAATKALLDRVYPKLKLMAIPVNIAIFGTLAEQRHEIICWLAKVVNTTYFTY